MICFRTYLIKDKKIKYIYLIINILTLILTGLLILFNLFFINFPQWIVWYIGTLSIIQNILYQLLFKTKWITKIILPLFFITIMIFVSLFVYCCPYWDSYSFKIIKRTQLNYDDVISYKQAADDLETAMYYLEKTHPMFKDGLYTAIEERYANALKKLEQMQTITVNDLRREIQVVINPIQDAHTTTYSNSPRNKYLKDAYQKGEEGYTFYSLNGYTSSEIIEAAKPYYSYESENWISISYVSLASLEFYGYFAPYTFGWKDSNGNILTQTYTLDDFVSLEEYEEFVKSYSELSDEEEEETPFVYYEIDEQKSLAILTLTECKYNAEYRNCVKKMFQEVKAKNIENVAVDVRGNGGGDSTVANEFIKYLPVDSFIDCPGDWRWGFLMISDNGHRKNTPYKNLLFEGNVYVLTNRKSFSAAMDFAQIIQDNKLGKVVGEIPANDVNGYGEIVVFSLPNTGISMQISTKKWYRIDASNDSDYVIPDYSCSGDKVLSVLYSII